MSRQPNKPVFLRTTTSLNHFFSPAIVTTLTNVVAQAATLYNYDAIELLMVQEKIIDRNRNSATTIATAPKSLLFSLIKSTILL